MFYPTCRLKGGIKNSEVGNDIADEQAIYNGLLTYFCGAYG